VDVKVAVNLVAVVMGMAAQAAVGKAGVATAVVDLVAVVMGMAAQAAVGTAAAAKGVALQAQAVEESAAVERARAARVGVSGVVATPMTSQAAAAMAMVAASVASRAVRHIRQRHRGATMNAIVSSMDQCSTDSPSL